MSGPCPWPSTAVASGEKRSIAAEIRAHPRTGTTSEIVWRAECQPSGIPAADAEGVVAGVFDGGLDNLAGLIAKETASDD